MTKNTFPSDAPEAEKKYDKGKAPMARGAVTRFPQALAAVAKVSQFGALKYSAPIGDMGYLNVEDGEGRYTDALLRHLAAEVVEGPINQTDGGVLHAAQVAWCALARLEIKLLARSYPEPDYIDRSEGAGR